MAVVTEAVGAAVEAVTGARPGDVPRMTWPEAMERFGSDKPDIRFGMELVDLGAVFAGTEFRAFQADAVKGICVPGEGDVSRLDRRQARRPGQAARRGRSRVDAGEGGRRARVAGRQVPVRDASSSGSSPRSARCPATSC